MKFSKKGSEKIGEFMYNFQRCVVSPYAKVITPLKFEPSDFEDCVVLTIKEAETIEHIIAIFQHYYNLFGAEIKVWQDLRKKIEQAGKQDEV